jgi:D-aminoacyl-tRNA deacylase
VKPYFTLVASKQDAASMTMANYLRYDKDFSLYNRNTNNSETHTSKVYKKIKLHIYNESLLHIEDLDTKYPHSKAFIFLSKHRSGSGIPTLTCHCTGNYADNPYGGNPRELALSYPYLQKRYLQEINNSKSSLRHYEIVIEASHHGPTSLKKPVLFIEIGSSEMQWIDRNAASIVCNCLLRVLENGLGQCKKVGICLGGTHYPSKFNKLLLESEFGLAAVAPKHNLESVDRDMLNQMIAKSIERVTYIIVDWKGLGKEKNRIMRLVENTGLEVLRV